MQLIRTVALDFNNALTSILGHTSLLLSKIEPKNPLRSSLVEIEKSAQRAAEVANDLAAFSRYDKEPKGQVSGNLNDLVRRVVELFRENHPHIAWRTDFQPKLYLSSVDEAKMQQAFLKVLENAVQAVDGTGRITISTNNLDVPERWRDGSVRLEPGPYICVEFSDSGCGIPAQVLPRIFEPFFTTKRSPAHRGLGLAWVYGIVTNHGGSVTVTSELNSGTSVRVYLPAQKKIAAETGSESGDLSGTQTILMVDDEDLLLTMGEMVLGSYGYRVLTAQSGQAAIDIFSERISEIDLVITDLVMPQVSGREVIERLRRMAPEVKIICMSGFVRPPSGHEDENYLQKPFASQDLLRKVKNVLSTGVREA